jgi:hypothetical protein
MPKITISLWKEGLNLTVDMIGILLLHYLPMPGGFGAKL